MARRLVPPGHWGTNQIRVKMYAKMAESGDWISGSLFTVNTPMLCVGGSLLLGF